MFSYRHAFHAGNHADVLKHLTLVATLDHLMQKDPGIALMDTHAGAGLYKLQTGAALTSAEADEGVLRLLAACAADEAGAPELPALVARYVQLLGHFNPGLQEALAQSAEAALNHCKIYPGSPFLMQSMLRSASRDRLKLCELHPSDIKLLQANVAALPHPRPVQVLRQDGFESLKAHLPPAANAQGSRRALVLIDPSYEIKHDYLRVQHSVEDSVKRFATGTYLVWYPIIARPEAHQLPKRLAQIAARAGRPWLHATLAIGSDRSERSAQTPTSSTAASTRTATRLTASGLFVINPPYTLAEQLRSSLAWVLPHLALGVGQGMQVQTGGA